MKTNNETLELPFLIPKAKTTPLMGLDWMQRLGKHPNTNNSEIQTNKIKMDDSDKKPTEKRIQGTFLRQQRYQRSISQNLFRTRAQVIQQTRRPTPMP